MRRFFNRIFWGAGGPNPRVGALNPDTGETQVIMSLPEGHSVYAIDTDLISGNLAVGTKGGLIYIIRQDVYDESNESSQPIVLFQGAPVLSVCWVGDSLLAVCDISGRCLLWDTNNGSFPHVIKSLKGIDCDLLNLDGDILAGLSSSGKLILCYPFEDKLIHVIDIPPLPPKMGLAKMVHWKAGDALAFPGHGGDLVICNLKDNRIQQLAAHEGPFYALSVGGDKLVTAGMHDFRLKIWMPDLNETVHDIKITEGSIALATAGNFPQSNIMLVNTNGSVTSYIQDGDKLQVLNRFQGKDYRVIRTSPQEDLQVNSVERTEKKVRHIVCEIRGGEGQLPNDDIDQKHSQLIDLGFEHVSLAIRISDAAKNEKYSECIRLYSSLLCMIPRDSPLSCPSIENYGALLEKVWQLEEASKVREEIKRLDPDYSFSIGSDNLRFVAKLIKNRKCIIEPEVSIEQIIESATAIGKHTAGRFVINKIRPEACNRIRLTSDMIQEKYNQIRIEAKGNNLPIAKSERVWWLNGGQTDQVDVVVCETANSDGVNGLQFVLQVFTGTLDTVVVPAIIFDMDNIVPDDSFEKTNRKVSTRWNQFSNTSISNSYMAAIHNGIDQALRRLVTELCTNQRI